MDKIVVAVDPDLLDLIPGFLSNKHKDSAKIAELIEQADFTALRGLGHKLKGEGGGYGLDGISTIGIALEDAAAAKDVTTLRHLLGQLCEYLEALEIVPDDTVVE